MVDYKDGKIYKISSGLTDRIYIGSTTKPIEKRFKQHQNAYKCGCNRLAELLMDDDAEIHLVESFPCDNRIDLIKREQHHLELNRLNVINMNKAYTPLKGLAYSKDYHQQNKNSIHIRKRNKVFCPCCACTISSSGKAKHCKSEKHKVCYQKQIQD